jgi:CRP/FNR family transcriptional regulator
VSLKDSKKRLVRFLLEMLTENKDRNSIILPFTREELAQRLGTTRETAVRQLYQLKDKKLIDIKSHQILILDKAGLEKLL